MEIVRLKVNFQMMDFKSLVIGYWFWIFKKTEFLWDGFLKFEIWIVILNVEKSFMGIPNMKVKLPLQALKNLEFVY